MPQRQSLREYLSDRDAVARGAGAWADRRNAVGTSVNWRFTTADARTKPHRLYPRFDT